MQHLAKLLLHGGAKLIGAQFRKQALPKRIMKKGGTESEQVLCSKRADAISKPGALLCSSKGDLILTSRRLAYFGNGVIKSVELHLPLWKISNVSFEKRWLGSRYLSFQMDDQTHCFSIDSGAELEGMLPLAIEEAAQSDDFPVF